MSIMSEQNPLNTPELFDLAGSLTARVHYAHEAFKRQIARAVNLGLRISEVDRTVGRKSLQIPADRMTDDDMDGYVQIADAFKGYHTFSEEIWEEYEAAHLELTMDIASTDWANTKSVAKLRTTINRKKLSDGQFALAFFTSRAYLKSLIEQAQTPETPQE